MRVAARIVESMHTRIYERIEPGMRKCDRWLKFMIAVSAASAILAATIRPSSRYCHREKMPPHLI